MSVSTNATEAVEAVYEILDNTTTWTNAAPDVFYMWEIPTSEKGPGADMPPQIYVWELVDMSITKFSADGDLTNEVHTVMAQIWLLKDSDETLIREYQRDIIDLFTEYYSDVRSRTTFVELRPISAADFREQSIPAASDYFINEVEIEAAKLRVQT